MESGLNWFWSSDLCVVLIEILKVYEGGVMKSKIILFAISLFLFSVAFAQTEMLATIDEPVETDFGIYQPYSVNILPNAPQYQVAADFSNVVNYFHFHSYLTNAEKDKLLQNNFVVISGRESGGTGYKEMYDIYNEAREDNVPQFITSDAVLHTFHKLYDKILMTAEEEHFIQFLTYIDSTLFAAAFERYNFLEDTFQKECFKKLVAYFSVPLAILKDDFIIPAVVSDTVNLELDLIEAHQGYVLSPLFGAYYEDYSQYKPRGHYTKTEELKEFFKAMMWHGRQTFILQTNLTGAALALVYLLENLQEEYQLWTYWNNIYIPTVFFVGKADDLLPQDYLVCARKYFGSDFAQQPISNILNEDTLLAFIEEADKYFPNPEITTLTPKGMRFMGQRYIPDSYVLDQLVFINVGDRYMPKSLDILAVMHSEEAFNLLEEMGETDYPNYINQLTKLKNLYQQYPDAQWAENLYWNWLYCLMPLLIEKGEGYPPFMQNLAWLRKDINTALGSWAELRHDTILYAKQSCTDIGIHPSNTLIKGYVEPNPYLFARLASLTRFMREGLLGLELLNEQLENKLITLEELLVSLKNIAVKELSGETIQESEYLTICEFGITIRELVNFDEYGGAEGPNPDSEDEMPVIADVHTDPNSSQCLEEGVGYPNRILVICQVEENLKIAMGGVFSYYEFCQPISNRLTDEEWREMLKTENTPLPPYWAEEFSVLDTNYVNSSPEYYLTHKQGFGSEGIDETDGLVREFELSQNYPNPFNPTTTIEFSILIKGHINLTVYDLTGREVEILVNKEMSAGKYSIEWNANDLPSGIYLVTMRCRAYSMTKKMLLLK